MAPVLRPRPQGRLSYAPARVARRRRASAAQHILMIPPAESEIDEDCQIIVLPEEEAEEAVEKVITDCHYWPEICSHIKNRQDNGVKAPRLELTCGICQIAVIRFPEAIMSNRENMDVDDLTVVPCGHVFGATCLYNWMETKFQAKELPACPTCRFPLLHQGCNHYIGVRTFSCRTLAGLPDVVPVPVPQGGSVTLDCRLCRERHVRGALLGTLRLMFDNSHVTRDRVDKDVRDNIHWYLSQTVTDQVLNAYNLWLNTNYMADEWV